MGARLRRFELPVLVGAISAGLIAIGLLLGHFTTFFSADAGVKYLAARSIARHWTDAAIPYPLARLDPHGRFVLPLTAWLRGRDFAGYSLPFEYLTALALVAFGSLGLILPQVAGTAALLWAQASLADLVGLRPNRNLVLICTALATPVLFYSLTLWEHTWGVGLFLAGTALLLRSLTRTHPSRLMATGSGLLLSASVLMRREMLIASVLVLVLSAMLGLDRRKPLAIGLAGLAFLLPVGAIMLLHPEPLALGLSHASPGRAPISTTGHAAGRLAHLEWLTAGGIATGGLVLLSALIGLIGRFRRSWLLPAVTLGALALALLYAGNLLSHYSWTNDNPLAYAPLLIWALWSPLILARSRLSVALWLLMFCGAAATMLFAFDYGGAQWGPRYLLFVFPIGIILALLCRRELLTLAANGASRRLVTYSFAVLLALSLGLQAIGVMALVTGKRDWSASAQTIAALSPHTVVSVGDPSVDSLVSNLPQKAVLWAQTPGDLDDLIRLLSRHGTRSLIFVCGPRTICDWGAWHGWTRVARGRSYFVRYAVFRLG